MVAFRATVMSCMILPTVGARANDCVIDYATPCPDGWDFMGEIGCRAPLSYTGQCSVISKPASMDAKGKKNFEASCNVTWPCFNGCTPDYNASCPVGWVHLGPNLCEAPFSYHGDCLSQIRMWDESFKRDFAIRCQVRWPCSRSCVEDFGRDCPEGWFMAGGICVASLGVYTGPCAPFADLHGMTSADKHVWAAACLLNFPCAGSSSQDSSCDRALRPSTNLCPSGWMRVGSTRAYCYAHKYEGICRPLMSVEQLQQIGRESFMKRCNVSWPCPVDAIHDSDIAARSGPIVEHK